MRGQCSPPLETLTLFQTKICDFPCPISDLTQNFIPYFRPDPYRPYPILIAKTFENFFKFPTIIKCHLSGEENKKNSSLLRTVPNSRSKCTYLTLFQTKMVKIDTLFQTKLAQKPYPLGPHISIWLIEGSTPLLLRGNHFRWQHSENTIPTCLQCLRFFKFGDTNFITSPY